MSKLDHTLFATWTQSNEDLTSKTITGCIIGKPVFIIHKGTGGTFKRGFCLIDVFSGAATVSGTQYPQYRMGTLGDYEVSGEYPGDGYTWLRQVGGFNCFTIIPTATSVTVKVHYAIDDAFYVYI
jgi:hypothetical protein